ncbi:UPF0481 protein [Camellia lanceoleosa]|uniref:UPF0481 protein n=1 Tax=Camellia lanceoleosa TaxID=1840588 RepID=A0ACC0F9Y2_9ERIC|nr:UPF0481 protein [Camellia lanceoleosa]
MAVLTSSSKKRKEESQKKKKAPNVRVPLRLRIMMKFKIGPWVEKIRKQLEDIKPCQGGHSEIFEVPSRLRVLEPAAFMPRVVSIGPYHHMKHEHLQEIETHKWRLLQHVLNQTQSPLLLDDLLSLMHLLVNDTKKRYDKPIGLTKPQFVEMMLLDACFILELLRVSVKGWESCGYASDPLVVFNLRGFIPFIQQDLLMLENQLPCSVLHCFFTIVWDKRATYEPIFDLVLEFFDPIIPGISKNLSKFSKQNKKPLHILDIVRLSLEPSQNAVEQSSETNMWIRSCCPGPSLRLLPGPNSFSFPCWQKTNHGHDAERTVQAEEAERESLQSPPTTTTNCFPVQDRTGRTVDQENKEEGEGHSAAIQEEKEWTIPNSPEIAMHSVTRLRGTGIIFETKDSTKFTDIEFKQGKLLIPPLLIHDLTKSIFLNLMAFEQCYPHCESYITSYISFMDELINSPKDVEHLNEKRIIVHQLGSEEDVATLFNNLRKEIVFDTSDYYLLDESRKLNQHYQQKWRTWKAILTHEYLKDPWKIISLAAASFLILLTLAQTTYTIISYHVPKP